MAERCGRYGYVSNSADVPKTRKDDAFIISCQNDFGAEILALKRFIVGFGERNVNIELIPHFNQDTNRVELLFCDFPCIDGNDFIFKCLKKLFDAELKERIDGMYFIAMKIQCNGFEYVLIWHEDFGNYGYCCTQTQEGLERFQADLQEAFSLMNGLFENGQVIAH